MSWLPVVGEGISEAYHHPPFSDIDVRDNANARLECALLDPLPPGPVKDALRDVCEEETGEPRAAGGPSPSAPDTQTEVKLDCDRGVRKVRKQLKRIEKVNVPEEALDEILRPMRKRLKLLKKGCKELGDALGEPSEILDELPTLPPLPDGIEVGEPEAPDLEAQAAGPTTVPTQSGSSWDSFRDFLGGFFGFLGVGS